LAPDAAELRAALRAAVGRVCPPWLADRADDLVQSATIRVLEIRRRREGEADFSPFYLRKVAYCALVDEIRKLRRRREVPIEEDAEDHPAADLPDPERSALGREIGRAIRGCLAGMIRPRRMAVALYLQGHGSNEVGRLLGWAPKKAENLIYRGLADLRGCLAAKGIER
jgi:RNA polymerase sigma-70 factor (ECF subfamily)